jgi:GT2 family glycosyltransferase
VAATTVAVVVPTRNRPARLAVLVRNLMAQTATIDELIVVDQSDTDEGRGLVAAVVAGMAAHRRPALRYVWDRTVDGAAAARNRGFDLATSDVIVCVDDDMVAEPDTLARLLHHHHRTPDLGAVTPVITNYRPPGRLQRALTTVFCRGPFRDERQPIYWRWRRYGGALVPVRVLGGGMIAIRRQALGDVRFDPRYRGASLGEDIDLSWALERRGWRLAIATDARVIHDRAPRPPQRYEEAMLTSWGFVFAKHQPRTVANRLAFVWFVTGVAVAAAGAAARTRSLAPLRSLAAGLRNALTGYRRASFLHPR